MNKEKKIYYSDLTNYVDVCFSCKSQNIKTIIEDTEFEKDIETLYCADCDSRDVGSVPPEEVI